MLLVDYNLKYTFARNKEDEMTNIGLKKMSSNYVLQIYDFYFNPFKPRSH
jgi:hypothetical protein